MATIDLNSTNFDQTLSDNDIVLIDFWAEWCGPCRMFAPVFEETSEKYPDVTFAKVDTEKEQEIAGSFGIRSIPTLALFRQEILIFMQPGSLPAEALEELVSKAQELDMDEVRAKVAAEEKKEK